VRRFANRRLERAGMGSTTWRASNPQRGGPQALSPSAILRQTRQAQSGKKSRWFLTSALADGLRGVVEATHFRGLTSTTRSPQRRDLFSPVHTVTAPTTSVMCRRSRRPAHPSAARGRESATGGHRTYTVSGGSGSSFVSPFPRET